MTYRRDRNRKADAAAALQRFAELESLLRERAELQVIGPRLIDDEAWRLANAQDIRPGELEDYVAKRTAELTEQINKYKDDPAVLALAEVAYEVGWHNDGLFSLLMGLPLVIDDVYA